MSQGYRTHIVRELDLPVGIDPLETEAGFVASCGDITAIHKPSGRETDAEIRTALARQLYTSMPGYIQELRTRVSELEEQLAKARRRVDVLEGFLQTEPDQRGEG